MLLDFACHLKKINNILQKPKKCHGNLGCLKHWLDFDAAQRQAGSLSVCEMPVSQSYLCFRLELKKLW